MSRRFKIVLLSLFAIAILVFFGWHTFNFIRTKVIYHHFHKILDTLYKNPQWGVNTDTAGLEEVPLADVLGDKTMVAFVLGQSNVANAIDVPYTPKNHVYNYYDGKCYKARDPLLGTSGTFGSVWTRFGDKLIDQHLYDKVLIINIARQGSSILNWSSDGKLSQLIDTTFAQLKKDKINVTHVFFHQGEADCLFQVDYSDYKFLLAKVVQHVRNLTEPTVPIIVAQASLITDFDCHDPLFFRCYKMSPDILKAQQDVTDPKKYIFEGPNTDIVVPYGMRYMPYGIHFNADGANNFADALVKTIETIQKPQSQAQK